MFNKIGSYAIIFSIFILVIISLLFAQKTYAIGDITGNFIDKTRIRAGNIVYEDVNPFDDNQSYGYSHDGCTDTFRIASGDFSSGSSKGTENLIATVKYQKRNGRGDCESNGEGTITVGNRGVRYVLGYKIDDNTIYMPSIMWNGFATAGTSRNGTYKTAQDGDEQFLLGGSDGDFDNGGSRILYTGNPPDKFRYQVQDCIPAYCDKSFDKELLLANSGATTTPNSEIYPDSVVNPVTSDSTDGTQGKNANCMRNANGFGLAWIMCPVYNVAESAMNKMLNYIRNIMYTKIGEDSTAIKDAWAGLRNVANGVFVVALLLILIGQALKGSW